MAQWWSTHTLSSEYLSSSPSKHIMYSPGGFHISWLRSPLHLFHSLHTDTHTTPHPAPPHTHTQVHTLLKITAKVNKRERWKNYSQIREVSSTVVLTPPNTSSGTTEILLHREKQGSMPQWPPLPAASPSDWEDSFSSSYQGCQMLLRYFLLPSLELSSLSS